MGGPEEEIAASQPAQLIQKRVASLSSELENTINHYRRLAKETYRLKAALMVLTVGFSLVGGIAGLSEVIGAKLAGMLALLPGLLAVFSTTMRFQAKANQHYRRKDALEILRHRLLYELPLSPTEADIAAVSQEWGELTNQMNDEWERSLQFDWAHFAANGRGRPHSNHTPPKRTSRPG